MSKKTHYLQPEKPSNGLLNVNKKNVQYLALILISGNFLCEYYFENSVYINTSSNYKIWVFLNSAEPSQVEQERRSTDKHLICWEYDKDDRNMGGRESRRHGYWYMMRQFIQLLRVVFEVGRPWHYS